MRGQGFRVSQQARPRLMRTSGTRWLRSSGPVTTKTANRLRELHSDRDRLADLGRRSENFLLRYSWRRIGKEYVELVDGQALAAAAARQTA